MTDENRRAEVSEAEEYLLRAIDQVVRAKYEDDDHAPGIATRAVVVATIQYADGDLGTAWIPIRCTVAEASGMANHALHEAHGAAYDAGDDDA